MAARTQIPLIVLDPATGNFIAGASVTFLKRVDDTNAVVYQGETGITPHIQPRTTDAQGRVSGWLDRGAYTAQITVPGYPMREEEVDSTPGGDASIDAAWIAAGAVGTSQIATGAVGTDDVADNAVTTVKIIDAAVATAKLQDGAVTTTKINDTAVTTPKISDGSVTAAKLAASLVIGDSTLYRLNIPSFFLGNSVRKSYIYPYYFPYSGATLYRDHTYLIGGVNNEPVTLTNIGTKVTVITSITGNTLRESGYIGLQVLRDGAVVGELIESEEDHGPYKWKYRKFYGTLDSLNCGQTFTVTPGEHTWNVRLTFSNLYGHSNLWYSGGSSMLEIKEEPNITIPAAITPLSQGPRSPALGTATSTGSGGSVSWANPNNILSSDNVRASVGVNNNFSRWLYASKFGFAIPSNATIVGYRATIEGSCTSSSGNIKDSGLFLTLGSGPIGANRVLTGTVLPDPEAVRTFGNNNDPWGAELTPANVNSTSFGLLYAVYRDSTGASTAYVDQMQLTIYYTVPG